MATAFGGITFSVRVVDDASFPLPTTDEGGFNWYDATIRCSRSHYESLSGFLTAIDIIPAMAMRGGGIVMKRWGPGSKSLVYPLRSGSERTRSAILVSLTPTGEILRDIVQSEGRWLILGSG